LADPKWKYAYHVDLNELILNIYFILNSEPPLGKYRVFQVIMLLPSTTENPQYFPNGGSEWQKIYIFRINLLRSTKWFLHLVYYVIFEKFDFFGLIHSAVKLAMGGLDDHYIAIQLNYFVKNIIIFKMAYRKSELYWMKLFFFLNYIFLFLIEYFDIFRGKTQSGGLGKPKMKN